jgi:anti-sigma factor RsiW
MSEHERIRALLPLAASGDTSPEELRQVREHLAQCDTCARLSEDFASLGNALRSLPTPVPNAEIVARVQQLAQLRLGRRRAWSGDAFVIGPLVAAGWIMAVATWPLLKAACEWMFTGWRVPGNFGAVLAFYSILGFLLSCIPAYAISRHVRVSGRTS